MVTGTSAQLNGGGMDVSVRLSDPDAKTVMKATPNVTMTVGDKSYSVYEMNPTVVPNVYRVRLTTDLVASIAKDTPINFE